MGEQARAEITIKGLKGLMRARDTLGLILFIFLTPGIVLVAMIYVAPSGVQDMTNILASHLFRSVSVEYAYSTLVLGAFVYIIVLVSAILYIGLSKIVNRLAKAGEN